MESAKQRSVIVLLRDIRSYEMNAWILMFLLLLPTAFSAVRLQCGHGTYSTELVESTTNFTLTCDGYDHLPTVLWQRKNERNTATINIGICNSSTCTLGQGIPPNRFSITYVSSSSSRLTSSYTARNDDGNTYLCDTETCKVNIMHPAVVDSCSLNVVSESWVGVVLCIISKAYSPSNNYSCHVFRNSSQAYILIASTTTYSPTNHSDARYRIGSCNFTTHLPSSDGTYSYTAVVYPGGTEKYIDTVVIEQPSDPTIECTPQKWIFENTILNCTSTTRNIGKPPGRLQCFLEDKLLINAGYGEKSVNFNSHTLKRQDNLSNITCRINWIRNITGQNYIIMITYPPSVPDITGGPFMEESQATLTCALSEYGNPPALLSWHWEDEHTPLGNTSRLTLPTVSRRENNRTIICCAENVFTKLNNSNIVARFKPVVYYKPVLNINNKMENNKCKLSLHHTVCTVVKGERIHLDCMSDSNPTTESVTWVKVDSNQTVSYSSVLDMTVSGCMDNGSYVCTATVHVPNTETIFMSSVQVIILVISETSETDAHTFPAGVETAITLTVVVCSLGFITFIIWRRKWILPCSENKQQNSHTQNVTFQRPDDIIELPNAKSGTIAQAETHSTTQLGKCPQSLYDALRIQEVGMTSAYDAVNYSRNSKDSSVKDRLDYEKVLTDQPVYSNVPRKS